MSMNWDDEVDALKAEAATLQPEDWTAEDTAQDQGAMMADDFCILLKMATSGGEDGIADALRLAWNVGRVRERKVCTASK